MDFLVEALRALPSIATSPLAFLGYAFTLLAWGFATNRAARLKVLLARIKDVPSTDRARIIQLELGEVLPSHISAEQWIRTRNNRYFLIAFIALLLTLLSIASVSIVVGSERAQVKEQQRFKQETIRRRQEALQERRQDLELRKKNIEKELQQAEMEYRRGATGLVFSPPEQKEIAIDIMNSAQAEIDRLKKEKEEIQQQLDNLPIE